MTQAHLNDDDLVALADGSLAEDDAAAARDHVERCDACAVRADAHQRLQQTLRTMKEPPDETRATAIARAALTAHRPSFGERFKGVAELMSAGRLAVVGALCVLAVVVGRLGGGDAPAEDEFVARGAPSETHLLQVFQSATNALGAPRTLLVDGAIVAADALALSVKVSLLPASGARAIAVFAQDATGRVTWLAPTWQAADESPTCLAVDRLPAVLTPAVGVTLDAPVGPLRTGLVIALDSACSLSNVDAHLEGRGPLPVGLSIMPGPTIELR